MTKEEKENLLLKDDDTGLKEEGGYTVDISVSYAFGMTSNYYYSTFYAKLTDSLYNNIRKLMREAVNLTLRMHSIYPKPG
jgi:adenine-specific DNA methylase